MGCGKNFQFVQHSKNVQSSYDLLVENHVTAFAASVCRDFGPNRTCALRESAIPPQELRHGDRVQRLQAQGRSDQLDPDAVSRSDSRMAKVSVAMF